jgi:hypothetical protein
MMEIVQLKRFVIFDIMRHDSSGGLHDIAEQADTLDEANQKALLVSKSSINDEVQILDLETRQHWTFNS